VKLAAWLPAQPPVEENPDPPTAPTGKSTGGVKAALPPAQTLKAAELLSTRGLKASFAFGPLPPVEMHFHGDMPLELTATSQLTVDETLLRQLASSNARLLIKVTQETADTVLATLEIAGAHKKQLTLGLAWSFRLI
jgi:hypothetical protein